MNCGTERSTDGGKHFHKLAPDWVVLRHGPEICVTNERPAMLGRRHCLCKAVDCLLDQDDGIAPVPPA
jgi:hypothetical protein